MDLLQKETISGSYLIVAPGTRSPVIVTPAYILPFGIGLGEHSLSWKDMALNGHLLAE